MDATSEGTPADAAANSNDNFVSSIDRSGSSSNNPGDVDSNSSSNCSNSSISCSNSSSSSSGSTSSHTSTTISSISPSGNILSISGGNRTPKNNSSFSGSYSSSTSRTTSQNGTTSSRSSGCSTTSRNVSGTSGNQLSTPGSTRSTPDAAKMGKDGRKAMVERGDSKTPAVSPVPRSRCSLNWGLYEQFLLVDLQPTEAALSALRLDSKLRSCLDTSSYRSFSSLAACTSPAAVAAAATAASSAAVAADEAFQRLQQKRGLLLSDTHVLDPGLAEGDPTKWQPILSFFSDLYPLSVSFLSASAFAPTDDGFSAQSPFQGKTATPTNPEAPAFRPPLEQGAATCMRSCSAIDWERLRKFYATLHSAGRSAAAKGFDALSAMTEKIQQLCDWLQGRVDCLLYPCQLRFILVLLECPFNEEDEKCSMPLLEVVRTVSMLKDDARHILVDWYESVPTSSLRTHLENIQQMITLRVLAYPDVNALRDGFSRPLRHALHALHILYAGNNRRRLRLEERALVKRKRRRHGLAQAQSPRRQPLPQRSASSTSASSSSFSRGPAGADPGAAVDSAAGAADGAADREGALQQQQQEPQVTEKKEQAEGRQQQRAETAAARVSSPAAAAGDTGEELHTFFPAEVGNNASASASAAVTSETAAAAVEVEMETPQEGDYQEEWVEEEDEEETETLAEEVPVSYEEFHNDAINSQQDVQRHDFAQWLQWRRSLLVSEERDPTTAVDLVSTLRLRCSRISNSRARAAATGGSGSSSASSPNGSSIDTGSNNDSSNSDRIRSRTASGNLGSSEGHSSRSSGLPPSSGDSGSGSSSTTVRPHVTETSGTSEEDTIAAAILADEAATGTPASPEAQATETAERAAGHGATGAGRAPAGGGEAGAAAAEVGPGAADEAGRASAAGATQRADAAAGERPAGEEWSATQHRDGRREEGEGTVPRPAESSSGSKNLPPQQQREDLLQEEAVQTSSSAGDNTPSGSGSNSSSSHSNSSSDNSSGSSSSGRASMSSSTSTSGSSSASGRSSSSCERRVRIAGSCTEERDIEGRSGKRGASSSAERGAGHSGARNEEAMGKHKSVVFSHVELPPRSSFEGETDFALLQHPFVLDAANKAAALKRQASLQQFSQARRVEMDAFFSLLLGDQAPSALDHSPFLDVTVRRDHIVHDTLLHLDRRMNNADVLKKALRVHFAGEEGVDEGGVRKEFFQLLIQELFSSGYDMFLLYDESRLCWFNPVSTEDASSFRLIGIIFGLAIYNGILLDVHFPLVIFKKLLSWPSSSLEDLEELQPTVARSLRGLLTASAADLKAMELTFSIELDRYGERVDVPLSDKYPPQQPVTVDNCADYVSAYVDFVLNKAVADPYRHFHEGFHRCVDAYTISLFRPEELQQVILGSDEQLNFESLQSGTLYQDGFTAESETVKAFWEVAHALSSEQKKKLLMFVTGSDRVPIKGLASLRLIIGRNGADSDRLPTAHTCFNFLLLPDYKKKEKLDRLLKIAIENCKGFGLR